METQRLDRRSKYSENIKMRSLATKLLIFMFLAQITKGTGLIAYALLKLLLVLVVGIFCALSLSGCPSDFAFGLPWGISAFCLTGFLRIAAGSHLA
jgi:hypothetical protein